MVITRSGTVSQQRFPAAKPEYPAAKPEYPIAKPEYPIAKPEYPIAKPGELTMKSLGGGECCMAAQLHRDCSSTVRV
jgi:hypothetical protein